MQIHLLLSLAIAAVVAVLAAIIAYRAGSGLVVSFMVYSITGSILTVVFAALRAVTASSDSLGTGADPMLSGMRA